VTLGNSDAEMVRAIADPRLESEFDRLMLADLEFSEALKAFATLWPVLNLKDVRAKIGFDVFQRFSRDEVLAGHAGVHVKRQPVGWVAGNTPSWEQTMKVIYEVRCNLFHGEKSPLNYRDELVHHSNNVLKAYIVKSGCLAGMMRHRPAEETRRRRRNERQITVLQRLSEGGLKGGPNPESQKT
jgi:hypothetical protein